MLALRLYVDLDAAVVHVQRSLEEKAGLRFSRRRLRTAGVLFLCP
jgi:hypothetical protein